MNKKKILSLALVVLLICTISFGTLAWFNDKDAVTNTFYVASSDDSNSADSIFSVDVWEKADANGEGGADKDPYGKDSDDDTVKFEKILPGDSIAKEPHVENTGAYPQFVRVLVTFSDAAWWEENLPENTTLVDLLKDIDSTKWELDKNPVYGDDDTITYAYYLKEQLQPGKDVSLFTKVTIPGVFTQAQMAELDGSFDIKVVAEAVQVDNLGLTAQGAFTNAGWKVGTEYGA